MECKCLHCPNVYENHREYKTSICDECFKQLNEDGIQPLKDALISCMEENNSLKMRIKELENDN
jgi:hypothetical protein